MQSFVRNGSGRNSAKSAECITFVRTNDHTREDLHSYPHLCFKVFPFADYPGHDGERQRNLELPKALALCSQSSSTGGFVFASDRAAFFKSCPAEDIVKSVGTGGGRSVPNANHLITFVVQRAGASAEEAAALRARIAALEQENEHLKLEVETLRAAPERPPQAAGSSLAAVRGLGSALMTVEQVCEVLDDVGVSRNMLRNPQSLRQWLAAAGHSKEVKFQVTTLVFGQSTDAAGGIDHLIGLDEEDIHDLVKLGLDGIYNEFKRNGTEEDLGNYNYVVHGIAQDEDSLPKHVKEDMKNGHYHGGPLAPGDYDMNHQGMRLTDFVNHSHAKMAKLKETHVAALRLYTTSTFKRLNKPLRMKERPHPFALTVYYIAAGLKKLRAVQAKVDPEGFATEMWLWRGMSNTTLDTNKLKQVGGTELAPMSTSASKDVAAKYAKSDCPLMFKYRVRGLTAGVSLKFLSVYPKEEEYLYPPGTFLTYDGEDVEDGIRVVIVAPQMS